MGWARTRPALFSDWSGSGDWIAGAALLRAHFLGASSRERVRYAEPLLLSKSLVLIQPQTIENTLGEEGVFYWLPLVDELRNIALYIR